MALIDFDMAAPGHRLHLPDSLDAAHRLGVLARGEGSDDASAYLEVIGEVRRHGVARGRELAGTGDPVWAEHVFSTAFETRVAADGRWLADQRNAFTAAVG